MEQASQPASVKIEPPRKATAEAFLDAAERLLVEVGHAGVSTRRLAAKAGANQGLVHYYFGSIDELFVQVLERFTERLVARQREMYAADLPFIEKWRTAGTLDILNPSDSNQISAASCEPIRAAVRGRREPDSRGGVSIRCRRGCIRAPARP